MPTLADRFNAEILEFSYTGFASPNQDEQVYFIGLPDGPVKIGFSNSVQARLAALQAGSPVKLEILAVVDGGRALERLYHGHFHEVRLHGEWFDLTDEMRREIKRYAW